jgi:alkylation response protein AidB-like acyl-CoA dehydrogenase
MSVPLPYGEDHALLRDEARRWLTERCSKAWVRSFAQGEGADDTKLWRELAELGWLGLTSPESLGGSGLGFTHVVLLLEECGRALLPAPLLPQLLAGWVLERAGSREQCERWLPGLASGEERATLAHVEPAGSWLPAATTVERRATGLFGEKAFVWGAPGCDLLFVPVRDGSALRFTRIECSAPGVEVVPESPLDATRPSGRVRLDAVHVDDAALLPEPADVAFAELLPLACTALAAEMVGGADALLDMTAAYAATREQFGKPIGSFQAIKHPLVNVLIGVEQARSLVYSAAAAIEAGAPEAECLARMAKAQASDAYGFAASRAIQFHGGYGFTLDCDAHLYLKRALATRPAFGDAAFQRRWIADHVIDGARASR